MNSSSFGYFPGGKIGQTASVWSLTLHYGFKDDPSMIRDGNDIDVKNLNSAFLRRNCLSRDFASLSKDDLHNLLANKDDALKNAFSSSGQSHPDVLTLFILSHGRRDGEILTEVKENGEYVSFNTVEVLNSLKESSKGVLKDTLIIVFFGACRGANAEQVIVQGKTETAFLPENTCRLLSQPNSRDFIVVYYTTEGMKSHRNLEKGTWFIYTITALLNRLPRDTPIEVFLTRVQKIIQQKTVKDGAGQTCEWRVFPHRKLIVAKASSMVDSTEVDEDLERMKTDRFDFFIWNPWIYRLAYIFKRESQETAALEETLEVLHFRTEIYPLSQLKKTMERIASENEDVCRKFMMFFVFGDIKESKDSKIKELCVHPGRIPIQDLNRMFTAGYKPPTMTKKQHATSRSIKTPKVLVFLDTLEYHQESDFGLEHETLVSSNHAWLMNVVCIGQAKVNGLISALRQPSLQNGGNLQSTLIDVISDCTDDPRGRVVSQITSTIPCLVDFPVRDDIYIEPTFIVKLSNSQDSTLSSSELATKITTSLHSNKNWLLSSGPGMGKTLATRKMAEELEKNLHDKYLVIRVNPISIDPDDDLKDAIFVQIKNKITYDEFKRFYDEGNIFLIIDSLDELIDVTEKEGVFEFIKSTADLGLNMWIASRPEESNSLMKVLQPEQVTCLTLKRFKWRERIQLLQGMLQLSAEDCKGLLERFQRETKNELTTNPMHLQMLAKTQRFDLTNGNISTLYENYFGYMAETALTRIEGKSKSHESFASFADARVLLLMRAALKKKFAHLTKACSLGEKAMDELQNVGVVEARGTDGYSFNHQTYVEFLISRSFLFLKDNEMKSTKIEKDLFNEVLVSDNCRQERQFIESFLKQTNLPVHNCVLNLDQQKLKNNKEKLIENICSEGLFNIFTLIVPFLGSDYLKITFSENKYQYLFKACQTNEKLALRLLEEFGGSFQEMLLFNSISGIDLLLNVIKNNHVYIMRSLIQAGVNFTNPDGRNKSHSIMNTEPLCLAVCSGHVDCTMALLDFFEASDLPELKAVASTFNRSLLRTLASFNQTMRDLNDDITDFTDDYMKFLYMRRYEILLAVVNDGSPLRTVMYSKDFKYLDEMVKLGLDIGAITKYGLTALHIAAEEGADEKTMRFLMAEGADVNARTNKGLTAYMCAAIGPKPIRSQRAFWNLTDVTTKNVDGKNLLHLAAEIDEEHLLVQIRYNFHRCLVNAQDLQGRTVFHYVALNGYTLCVDRLLELKADLNALDGNNQSPLHIALEKGHVRMAKKILSLENVEVDKIDADGKTELHLACERGMKDIVEHLISKTSSLSRKSNEGVTPFLTAVEKGFQDIAEVFYSHDILVLLETDSNGLSAPAIARKANNIHFAAILEEKLKLLEPGLEEQTINQSTTNTVVMDDNLIDIAANSENIELLNELLNVAGPDQVANVMTCLMKAVMNRKPAVLNNLLTNFSHICREQLKDKPILSIAIGFGSALIVKRLLTFGVDVNYVDDQGYTPLIHAMHSKNVQILEVILNHPGVDLRTVSKGKGFSAAYFAISNNNLPGLKMLLEKDGPVDIMDSYGMFPIYYACNAGMLEAVKIIVQHNKANADMPDSVGATPITGAAAHGHLDICDYLLSNGADLSIISNPKIPLLTMLIHKGDVNTIKWFLQRTTIEIVSQNEISEQLIKIALLKGDKEILGLLLENGADLFSADNRGNKPIHYASTNGNLEAVEFFVSLGVEVNEVSNDGMTALAMAVGEKHWKIAEYLFRHGADAGIMPLDCPDLVFQIMRHEQKDFLKQLLEKDPNMLHKVSHGLKPIHFAAVIGDPDILQILLDADANPRDLDTTGMSVLHHAVKNGNLKCIQMLLNELDADSLNLMDSDGMRPLELAVTNRNLEILQCLLTKDEINPNLKNKQGLTAFLMAVGNNSTNLAKFMIRSGKVNMHETYQEKENAVHYAAQNNNLELVKLLVEAGVDYNFCCSRGRTPIFYAVHKCCVGVLEYLLSLVELDPNMTCDNVPIAVAALQKGSSDILRLLINHGVDVNFTTSEGTLLAIAIGVKDYTNAKLILECSRFTLVNYIDQNNATALLYTAMANKLELVQLLLERGADPNIAATNGNTALHYAVEEDAFPCVDILSKVTNLEIRNCACNTPLHIAVEKSNIRMTKALCDAGAFYDICNYFDRTPIDLAIAMKRDDILNVLLDFGKSGSSLQPLSNYEKKENLRQTLFCIIEANSKNGSNEALESTLHTAVENNFADICRKLIELKVDVNAKDSNGSTALQLAIVFKSFECLEILLNSTSINVNLVGRFGDSPIHCSIKSAYAEGLKLLIRKGADVNFKDQDGNPPLHLAFISGYKDCLDLLLSAEGVNLDQQDAEGRTLLHFAVTKIIRVYKVNAAVNREDFFNNPTKMVSSLIAKGANPRTQDNCGRTPLHLAAGIDLLEVVKMLIDKDKSLLEAKDNRGKTPLHSALEEDATACIEFICNKCF